MFHPLPPPQDFFANISNNKIEYILQPAEILVNFRTQNFKAQKHCLVYVEKIDSKGLFQLRFTEKCDRRKMYITTVDGSSFQQLKHDQSLNVTFSGFVENLIHILKECHAGKLDINIMEFQLDRLSDTSTRNSDSIGRYELQFVENRPFKNLIHLCLPCRAASQSMVLFYMNNILDEMQNKLLEQEQNTQHLQLEIQNQNQRIEQLEEECTKVRNNLLETTRSINQKNSKDIMELQERLRKSTEQRQQDNERSRNTINALQQQIDKVVGEKSIVQTEKCNAQKHNEMLKEELSALKINLTNLTESNEKLYNEISALKNLERKHEIHLKDCRKEVNDCKEIIKKHEKCKAELVAELEAEKKISQTKRQALEIATEEISKANEIILKQRQELCKLKKVVDWRTEVSLQQEQAIKMKDVHIKERSDQIIFLKQTLDSLRTDIPKELDSMRKFAAALDAKYSEQITAMQLKLKPLEKDGKKDVTGNTRHK